MGSKKRQQTINKRNRERAVADKRALKQQARQEKREAIRNGEVWPPEAPAFEHAEGIASGEAPPPSDEAPPDDAAPPGDTQD